MVTITTIEASRYRVEYRLEGVLVSVSEYGAQDLSVAMLEVKQHMQRDMGLAKGKVFTTGKG